MTQIDLEAQKAELRALIRKKCKSVPGGVVQSGMAVVRQWQAAREKSLKDAEKSRASVGELQSALASMERFT